MASSAPTLSVTEFVSLTNQTLEYAYQVIEVEGEIASFSVNQNKFVFFDLKDSMTTVSCFMMVFALRMPIEDGMKVIVKATPKVTNRGKFSLTVQQIRPSGEGSLKKSFELLKAKLEKEGLFAPERKRSLPTIPQRIAVISSKQAAGFADFIKILSERWGGIVIDVLQVQVQGEGAPDQIIRAINYVNQLKNPPEIIALIRGGGSADDLSAFNDEQLVRTVASSRVPTISGIGHETDESLVDMAVDVQAVTPSNAAQLLVPDRQEVQRFVRQLLLQIGTRMLEFTNNVSDEVDETLNRLVGTIEQRIQIIERTIESQRLVLDAVNPDRVLERGYAIIAGEMKKGATIEITTAKNALLAEVKDVKSRK